jgi:hypothetical protein
LGDLLRLMVGAVTDEDAARTAQLHLLGHESLQFEGE